MRRLAALAITLFLGWLVVVRFGTGPGGGTAFAFGLALLAASIVGWLAVITGLIRMFVPERAAAKARVVIANPMLPKIGAAIWLAIGAALCFFGYRH